MKVMYHIAGYAKISKIDTHVNFGMCQRGDGKYDRSVIEKAIGTDLRTKCEHKWKNV